MSRQRRPLNMPAPYLRGIWLEKVPGTRRWYPFCLPLFQRDFELNFDHSITIVMGENGTGKSTLLEGIAAVARYDDAGGGKGYMPVDHSRSKPVAAISQKRFAPVGCRSLRMAGSSRPKASSRWRAILIGLRLRPEGWRRTFCLAPRPRASAFF
jgi:hypothetical protein